MLSAKRISATFVAVLMAVSTLTGCQSKDKGPVKEAAEGFIEAIKTGSTDKINEYSSDEVASGSFVQLFDAASMKDALITSLGNPNLESETEAKLDEFYSLYSSLVESYEVTDIAMNEDGTAATAYVTMTNSFPYDVVTNNSVQTKFSKASEAYNVEHEEELLQITNEQGAQAAIEKACNDLIVIALDIYEEEIDAAEPITYMLALTLNKNEETGSWYVTGVQSYDSSIAGTGAPATDTDTTATEASTEIDASAATASTEN
ncbi:hypothetical protein D6855_01795 [Butyrivibrio sp. CB08]|uniref:hypothetical protein n=1 Tax=Butyrivibrio sp. CB08 TaxID=2364879 RepID=UPI000EAA7A37|nr:hypothetical protein [Butyrivibrio sp. CB08]RKM62180.1 hypothetical protein D6855_01795 [Butyrivibrio sp. CB08]